ncbi:MAG TPA: SCO family protein [Bacillota bacterium]|nr:SCO family protein [Bacillota bacterium]
MSTIMLFACQNSSIEENMDSEVADFLFTNESEEPFGLKDVSGEYWIAYFLYTDCKLVCPTTTPNMVSVQEGLQAEGIDTQIVAFTVDLEKDTPEVLREYAAEYDVDLTNWSFVIPEDFEDVRELAIHSFETFLEGGGPEDHAFAHSTSFFLVNPEGKVIKRYDGMSKKDAGELVEDIKRVS